MYFTIGLVEIARRKALIKARRSRMRGATAAAFPHVFLIEKGKKERR